MIAGDDLGTMVVNSGTNDGTVVLNSDSGTVIVNNDSGTMIENDLGTMVINDDSEDSSTMRSKSPHISLHSILGFPTFHGFSSALRGVGGLTWISTHVFRLSPTKCLS